jgi:hypothetical protein
LSDYGLIILGSHVQNASKEQVRSKAESLGATFTIASQARVKDGNDFSGIPHTMLFDHTGKCLYRGTPDKDKVEREIRAALGKSYAEGIDKSNKSLAPLLDALTKGQSPASVLPKVVPLMKSPNSQTAEGAKKLVDNITVAFVRRVETAEKMKSDDPAGAYSLLEKMPGSLRGTPVATKATELLSELKKDKTVQAELKARPSLDTVRKLDSALSQAAAKAKIDDLKDSKFLKANAASITQLQKAVLQLNKSYPDTKAAQEAALIGDRYGITAK